MERTGGVEMAANGIAVECNETNISELRGYYNKAWVWLRACNGFTVNKEAILHHEVWLTQSRAKVGVQLGILQTFVGNCPRILDKLNDGGGLWVIVIGVGPPLGDG